VIATSELSVPFADALGAALDVPGNPVCTAAGRRDKVAMRALALEAGVRVPRYRIVEADGIRDAVAHIGYPAILKPPTGAGAHGVHLVRAPTELEQVLSELETVDLFGRPVARWLVEQYVRGRELAVNAFTVDGRHTIVDVWEYRQPGTDDDDQPYWDLVQLDATDPDFAAAREFVLATLDVYGVRIGPSHTEIKVGASGPVLIEIASRLPGAHRADQWRLHGAVQPYRDVLCAFLGEDPGAIAHGLRSDAALAIVCVPSDRAGHLVAIHGLDAVAALPGVDRVFVNCPPGQPVTRTAGLDTVPVVVLVHAPDPTEREHLVAAVRRTVRLELA
jgi:biotin carboxylase